MIFAELQQTNGETLLVIRAVAPKDPHQVTPTEVPNFTIYIDESWNTNDYITAAITDITTRTFKEDQIKLMTACQEAPNHLNVEKSKKIEAAHAATQPHEILILVTAEPDEKDHYLTVLNTKTGQEFKVSNQIGLTDVLCDFIKPLKTKTMTNIKIRITPSSEVDDIKINNSAPKFEKVANEYFCNLIDLASEVETSTFLLLSNPTPSVSVFYKYEDLTLPRPIEGGFNLTI